VCRQTAKTALSRVYITSNVFPNCLALYVDIEGWDGQAAIDGVNNNTTIINGFLILALRFKTISTQSGHIGRFKQ
jgi:hypothetical protein